MSIDLTPPWNRQQLAAYLGVCSKKVGVRYTSLPDFPKPARIKDAEGHLTERWRPRDVIAWLEGYFPQ